MVSISSIGQGRCRSIKQIIPIFKNWLDKIFVLKYWLFQWITKSNFWLNSFSNKSILYESQNVNKQKTRIPIWFVYLVYLIILSLNDFHGMSSTDIPNKNYSFEIKFGPYHQKVTITMNPFSLTMNTLREVAIRFIETMVSFSKKTKLKFFFLH